MEKWRRDFALCVEDWRTYWGKYRRLAGCFGLIVGIVYGGYICSGSFFLDSEIMAIRPEFMRDVWLGSNRFGMVATSLLFGLGRLNPWLSNILMGLVMWACALFLSFSSFCWTGGERRYRFFYGYFPALFLTAPVFVEQYLFVLQSFEISVGMFLTLAAAYCSDRSCRRGGNWHTLAGLFFLVWALGTYQAFAPMYLSLALAAFLLRCLTDGGLRVFSYGLRQAGFFLAACLLYLAAAVLVREGSGVQSDYIGNMIRWKTDGTAAALAAIQDHVLQIMMAARVFFRPYYLPAMALCVLQALCYGWKEKAGKGFGWFVFGGGLLLLSPFYMTFLTGGVQPIRTQFAYPVTAALFLAHLTVAPRREEARERINGQKKAGRAVCMLPVLMTGVCLFCAARQGRDTAQLFQTAGEAYRNDVLTANRMYPDICRAAGAVDMKECSVIFIGGRDAGIQGPALYGELAGKSFFGAEAHVPGGVSSRLGGLFPILGMDLKVEPENVDAYFQAVEYMKDAPDWPAEGSIRKMGGTVVVRLSGDVSQGS